METPNVNNLNGVPNFGHGLEEDGGEVIEVPETEEEFIPNEVDSLSVDEGDTEPNTEETVKKYGKNKRTTK